MSAIGPKQTSATALHMSAFGGKADMTGYGSPLSRSLLGVKRTCLCALHMSAYDPKRTSTAPSSELVFADTMPIFGLGQAMERREFITLVTGAAAAWSFAASAQQKSVGIGFLGAGAADTSAHLIEAIKQGLRENGLVEGKDYVLEQRWAEGHYERFPTFAREL